jgi:hypothetical protein
VPCVTVTWHVLVYCRECDNGASEFVAAVTAALTEMAARVYCVH